MQTDTTDAPRLGYAKGGKIQCMAGGGLVEKIKAGVNKLVGNNPGAMAARGRSEEADAPQPSTTGTTAPTMETVKKAKGGSIPKPPKGAAPHPESTGTDTVPIMGTPGEFMVRKPAVDKIEAMAPGLLNALNAMGDDKPKLGKVKRRRRGKRKPMEMGGPVTREELVAQIPTGGTGTGPTPPAPGQSVDSTEVSRNVGNAIMALPGASPALGAVRALTGATRLGGGIATTGGAAAGAARAVGPYAAPAAIFGVPAAMNAGASAPTPPPPVAPSLGVITRPPAGAGMGAGLPGQNPQSPTRDFTRELSTVPKDLPADLRQGVIYKTMGANGNPVYSGANIGPDAQMVNGKGANVAARGGVTTLDMSEGRAQVQRGLAQLEADKAAKSDPIEALINNGKPMTVRKAAAIAQMQASRAQAQNATTQNNLGAQRLAMDKETADLTNREKKSILSAQDAYANAKTPAEKDAAENRLRAITQKWEKAPPDEYAAIAGGVDALGNKSDPLIYSKRTGLPPAGQPAKATALPPKDKLVKGQKYDTPRGPAVWDGSKFVAG